MICQAITPCKEEDLRQLKPVRKGAFQNHRQFFIPVLYTAWNVEYQNVFRKVMRSRVIIGEDFIRGKFGFADQVPDAVPLEIDEQDILLFAPENLEKQLANAHEFIRKFYIHQKRSWSVPIISLHEKKIVYLPYSVFLKDAALGEKKDLLLEHYSMDIDLLMNHRPVRELLLAKGKEGD